MAFARNVIGLEEIASDFLEKFGLEGERKVDKAELEQEKIRTLTAVVNFLVSGGIVAFPPEGERRQVENVAFQLKRSLLVMLDSLNSSRAGLLVRNLGPGLREHLSAVHGVEGNTVPVRVFDEAHLDESSFVGLDVRDSRGHEEDIRRIEADSRLKQDILQARRSLRYTDIDLAAGLMKSGVKKILIAEDDTQIARLVQFKLEKEGYEVLWEKDGAAALETARREMPDLIILDIMMPVLDGFQVLKKIKEDESTSSIPAIILSARGQERDVVKGIEMGSADYMVKPFRPAELAVRIRKLII